MSLKNSVRRLVAWLERGTKHWLFVRGATSPLEHKAHKRILEGFITETMGLNPKPTAIVGMHRRIEVWRAVKNLTPEQMKDALKFEVVNGVEMALIDADEKLLDFEDLVVDAGLNALCGQAFDSSGSRPAVFGYVAIGTDGTTPAASQTALGAEVMRVSGTYTKDAAVGECSMDATFNITATYALQECGLLNAASAGTMYCRDTYATKNVVSGDTVKAFEECPRMRPKFITHQSSKDLLKELDKPDYDKYEGIKVFDDVMWILKSYTPKFQTPA